MSIEKLREQLFATLEGLRDKENPLDIERAKAICTVADVIVDTAKVEVEHMKVTGGKGSGFIPLQDANEAARQARDTKALPNAQQKPNSSKGI